MSPGRFFACRVREDVQRQFGITLRVSLVDAVADDHHAGEELPAVEVVGKVPKDCGVI
jgi:hypothetical protein